VQVRSGRFSTAVAAALEFLAADQPLDGANAVQVVVDLEESVEHEQLTDGVRKVQQLHGQIGRYQVVPVELTCNATHRLLSYLLSTPLQRFSTAG